MEREKNRCLTTHLPCKLSVKLSSHRVCSHDPAPHMPPAPDHPPDKAQPHALLVDGAQAHQLAAEVMRVLDAAHGMAARRLSLSAPQAGVPPKGGGEEREGRASATGCPQDKAGAALPPVRP